jgi:hypothetical protein
MLIGPRPAQELRLVSKDTVSAYLTPTAAAAASFPPAAALNAAPPLGAAVTAWLPQQQPAPSPVPGPAAQAPGPAAQAQDGAGGALSDGVHRLTVEGRVVRVMASDRFPLEAHFCVVESAPGVPDIFVPRRVIPPEHWVTVAHWSDPPHPAPR